MKAFALYLFAIAVVIALVVSCSRDHVPPAGVGELAIEGAQRDRTNEPIEVMVVVHRTVEELNIERNKTILANNLEPAEGQAAGWSITWHDGLCEVHILPIESVRDDDRMEVLGHELAHCLYGSYHQ